MELSVLRRLREVGEASIVVERERAGLVLSLLEKEGALYTVEDDSEGKVRVRAVYPLTLLRVSPGVDQESRRLGLERLSALLSTGAPEGLARASSPMELVMLLRKLCLGHRRLLVATPRTAGMRAYILCGGPGTGIEAAVLSDGTTGRTAVDLLVRVGEADILVLRLDDRGDQASGPAG